MKSLKILNHPLIKKAEIARAMFPGDPQHRKKLFHKENKKDGHSILPEDEALIESIWEEMKKEIDG